ncbi:MAG: flagellar hook-associated protein FlgL [Nitrospiraceae bacterium]|nr:flagellar hook-associated protein FlgL [Nitrospiraceae bacterium]
MRITTRMFYDNFLAGMNTNLQAIVDASEQISSGKRVNKPSDDPLAMSRIIGYKTETSQITQYKRGINTAKDSLETMDSTLTTLSSVLSRAKELAVKGASGTETAQSRAIMAQEADVILQEAIGLANTRVGNRYIFAGYQSNTAPIDSTGAFATDSNSVKINIGDNIDISLNMPANELFNDSTALPANINTNAANGQYVLKALNYLKQTLADPNATTQNLQDSIGYIDGVSDVLSQKMGEVGAKLNKVTNIADFLDDRQFNVTKYLSTDQSADVATLVTQIAQRQTSLEGLRQVTTQFLSTNLFSFLG